MTHARANILLLAAGAIWGLGFVAQSSAMSNIGPYTFVGLRFLLAALTVVPLAIREARAAASPLSRADYYGFAFLGVLLFIGSILQQIGLETTTVTNAGFLTGLYVVMVPFLAVIIYRQWPHPVVWPCALSALAGIYLLSGGHLQGLTTGDWLIVACAIFWALQIIFMGRIAIRSGRPIMLSLVQFLVCGVLSMLISLPLETPNPALILAVAPEIIFAGVFSSGIGFTLQAIGQRFTTAPQAAIMLSSEALFAALFGTILLGERMGVQGMAGCALIFIAMIAVELIPAMRKRATA
ncbi:DMT family transporter [Phyllobacterium sp. 0TCS1.6C]|uniref:DMT family transporter n=1 Tax=unclassified Phyllobacterium TaxID=2638441 RepID=UPI002265520F|nr:MULTISPECIES: DMT family transporter [unclassified Phyllobacterium]MCX8282294.1 DMT family transporter [Phyllobacterium sp. 0TCS1.6C]MCX8292080.1 DMT family transporter [Phyllobacterium sp. 0TCS1.6A]